MTPGRVASALGIVVLTAACAAAPGGADGQIVEDARTGGAPTNADLAGRYVRMIEPFVVFDEAGTALEQPFLGGFNIPRPQLVDIDGDGDADLFVQEVSGSVMFFEHMAGETPRYQWRTDRYQDLEIGEWYRFVDLDRDGDVDLLAERPFSYEQ